MNQPFASFAALEMAAADVVATTRAMGVRLQKAELLEFAQQVAVLFFYEGEADVAAYENDGTTRQIEDAFLAALNAAKLVLPFSAMPRINFEFDSHENVVRNFEGSYFLRLR